MGLKNIVFLLFLFHNEVPFCLFSFQLTCIVVTREIKRFDIN